MPHRTTDTLYLLMTVPSSLNSNQKSQLGGHKGPGSCHMGLCCWGGLGIEKVQLQGLQGRKLRHREVLLTFLKPNMMIAE